ncbi:DUF3349 domain-containing protein [Psychromicrobium xiongbiense]|uniref:DUF3349 domain-containing protein n=1 Tax=Psychromicrobium xiongbiense TaxID=3051184 RepID=UPI0025541430|nr:DUF3349 domain-containing protein [Psychromicrobium sp. YIM S02556]
MSEGIIAQVLRWLRAGYPEGVPPKDFTPLLALLRRTLSDEEFQAILEHLEAQDADPVHSSHVRDAIAQVTLTDPDEDAIREVASRLAAAGWPLSAGLINLTGGSASVQEPRTGLVAQAVRWLSVGYPEGVPAADQVPILALLRRRLTDDEVREVAETLVARAPSDDDADADVSAVDAQVLMLRVLGELPSEPDLERVRAHLAAGGWTLS